MDTESELGGGGGQGEKIVAATPSSLTCTTVNLPSESSTAIPSPSSSTSSSSNFEKQLDRIPTAEQGYTINTGEEETSAEYDDVVLRSTTTRESRKSKRSKRSFLRTRTRERNNGVIGGGGGAGKEVFEGDDDEEEDFEISWEGPGDHEDPMNWPLIRKAGVLLAVSFQTLMVVLYSTAFLSGGPGLMEEFGISSRMTIALGMTTYMVGLASGPLVLAPMSELYGRKPVYLLSLFLFWILVLPACLAQNYTTILVVRFLGAFVGSVTISNAPGSLSDIFSEDYRTLAFSCFCLAPMNGPVIGPLIGGFIYENLGWRWTNWIVFIGAGIGWGASILMPETYSPILLKRKASRVRAETGDDRYRSRFCTKAGDPPITTGGKRFWKLIGTNMARPIIMGLTEPICIFWELYIAVIYAILYLCFVGYPIVFTQLRGWPPGYSGLAFCGIGVGTILGLCLDPVNRKIYQMHKIDPETGKRPPEARIAILCLAAVLSPMAVLWFAWTCYPTTIHWIWPILSGVPYGIGNTLIFIHGSNYLVDSYDIYAASALAGNAVVRSLAGGILPLFGAKMYEALGPNWAGTLVGCLSASLIPIPWGFYKWGKLVRMRSPLLKKLQQEKAEAEERMERRVAAKEAREGKVGNGGAGGEGADEKV